MHRMEAAGLARRMPAEQDGRVVTVHLTAEGPAPARRSSRPGAATLIDSGLQALSPDEREQLVELLERFLGALARTPTAATADEPAG